MPCWLFCNPKSFVSPQKSCGTPCSVHVNTHTPLLFLPPLLHPSHAPWGPTFTACVYCRGCSWKFALLETLPAPEPLLCEKSPGTTCLESGNTWLDAGRDAELGWRASPASTDPSLPPRRTMLHQEEEDRQLSSKGFNP